MSVIGEIYISNCCDLEDCMDVSIRKFRNEHLDSLQTAIKRSGKDLALANRGKMFKAQVIILGWEEVQ